MFSTTTYRRLMVPHWPADCTPNILSQPHYIDMVDNYHLQPEVAQSCYQVPLTKIKSHSPSICTSFSRIYPTGISRSSFNVQEPSDVVYKPQVSASLLLTHIIDEESQVDSTFEYLENLYVKSNTETERRRKIGLAKKGKIPWNKGRRHSTEARELIKQRTREALKDPKVRRKMFERKIHAHSEETRVKMVLGQKKAWILRLKLKSIREKFYCMWGESIAQSAKKGWFDQQELEWDSYERMVPEMALQQFQLAADKENAKTAAKLVTVREKMEKRMERSALRKKEKEEKARSIREVKRKMRIEAKAVKQEISNAKKLKARITKIHKKKAVKGQVTITEDVTTSHEPTVEKLDKEFIKREKLRREMSFADQIRAAKQKRAESAAKETPKHHPPIS